MTIYDKIIIGAGPSGMMAAISASYYGYKVLLIDKNKRLGKKLRLTGGGRCNVTNNGDLAHLLENIPGNGRFLYSVFSQFDNQDIMAFFKDHGCPLKVEDHGRVFPASDRSASIIETLSDALLAQGVTCLLETEVTSVAFQGNHFQVKTPQALFQADKVILATGGKTYPSTGSTGFGYEIAKRFGHDITKLTPAESPLIMTHPIKSLQGLTLQDVTLSDGKHQVRLDLLFTHFGLSGPCALRLSSLLQTPVTLTLDFFPDLSLQEVITNFSSYPKKQIKNALTPFLPERLLGYLLAQAKISEDKPSAHLNKQDWTSLAQLTKALPLEVSGSFSLDKSFVTKGGVDLRGINPKTLESKLQAGLYITGETLDINAHTGGFNITVALCTGWVAGIQ